VEYGVGGEDETGVGCVRRDITVPRVRRDLLLYAPSFRRRSWVEAFSLPARSIMLYY